jgi:hypothetical protein
MQHGQQDWIASQRRHPLQLLRGGAPSPLGEPLQAIGREICEHPLRHARFRQKHDLLQRGENL